MATGHRDVPGDLLDVAYDGQAPLGLTAERRATGVDFGMWISVVIGA
ncbi:hypothetical protein ACIBQ5_36140 [Streptomyces massasporeus]